MAAPLSAARTLLARPAPVESDATPRVPPFSAIVVIHTRLGTLEHPEALRSWVYGIVRRKVSTYRRSRCARKRLDALRLGRQTPAQAPFDVAEHREQAKLLSKLLEKLDSPKREAFVLVELEELTVPEIAGLLGVPVNTVYSRLRAGRQEFNEALARHSAQRGGRRC